MFRLYLANELESLLETLLKQLQKAREKLSNSYEPLLILIPNRNIEYWLKQKIAEHHNIYMNYEFYFFEEGLWKIYTRLLKNQGLQELVRIDPDFLSVMIYNILYEHKDKKELQYFSHYIKEHEKYPGNIYDLSLRLAEIFFRYQFHNRKLMDYFLDSRPLQEEKNSILMGEKFIYQQLINKLKEWNSRENTKHYELFFHYKDQLIRDFKKQGISISLFVFAFQFNNAFYFDVLKELKDVFDIFYFQLILYDYQEAKNQNDIFKEDPVQRISYLNVELLKEKLCLTEEEIEFIPRPDSRKSLLEEVQSEFLKKGIQKTLKKPPRFVCKNHGVSLQWIQAPSQKIEIQAVISDIQNQLIQDKELKLNDIAILSPNLEEYFPLLKGYLEYLNIPYNIQDPSISAVSHLAEGIILTLEILEGLENQEWQFSRKQMVQILENPLFIKKHRLSRDIVNQWIRWILNSHIYYDHSNDVYHSWEIAFKRIRFAHITEDKLIWNPDKEYDLQIVPYKSFDMELPVLEMLHRSLEEFRSDIKKLCKIIKEKTINKVCESLHSLIEKHFFIDTKDDTFYMERKVYYEFKKKLSYLRINEVSIDENFSNFLKQYFILMFQKLKSNIHEYLFEGITIASLLPLRPIPFKRIYILGMNLETFPGKEFQYNFDLIHKFLDPSKDEKELTNIINKIQENQFLFYELFFSTRQCFTLSYVNYDIASKKELYPSYIYEELIQMIGETRYLVQIPYTFKIEENIQNRINRSFEFFNFILIHYRENLKYIPPMVRDQNYIKEIFYSRPHIHSLKELYENCKWGKYEKRTIQLIKNHKENPEEIIIDINQLISFIQLPLKFYLVQNQIAHQYWDSSYQEKLLEIPSFHIKKTKKKQYQKEIFIEWMRNPAVKLECCKRKVLEEKLVLGELPPVLENNNSIQEFLKEISDWEITELLQEIRNCDNKLYKSRIDFKFYFDKAQTEQEEIQNKQIYWELPSPRINDKNITFIIEGTFKEDTFIVPEDRQENLYWFDFEKNIPLHRRILYTLLHLSGFKGKGYQFILKERNSSTKRGRVERLEIQKIPTEELKKIFNYWKLPISNYQKIQIKEQEIEILHQKFSLMDLQRFNIMNAQQRGNYDFRDPFVRLLYEEMVLLDFVSQSSSG